MIFLTPCLFLYIYTKRIYILPVIVDQYKNIKRTLQFPICKQTPSNSGKSEHNKKGTVYKNL